MKCCGITHLQCEWFFFCLNNNGFRGWGEISLKKIFTVLSFRKNVFRITSIFSHMYTDQKTFNSMCALCPECLLCEYIF